MLLSEHQEVHLTNSCFGEKNASVVYTGNQSEGQEWRSLPLEFLPGSWYLVYDPGIHFTFTTEIIETSTLNMMWIMQK